MPMKIEIFDSTLRDGAQGEGITFSVSDKLNIVRTLDEFGIAYIEAGNPGSNPKDLEFFKKVKDLKLSSAKLCAFGSTRKKDTRPEEDANIVSLLQAETGVVVIFGKSWDLHVTKILKTTLDENLAMIRDTVAFFKAHGKEVIYDAEHFFDGYKADRSYAIASLKAAVEGGADLLCLCDTNGGTFPDVIGSITKEICSKFPIRIGIHCHNDSGLAVANSLMAVEAGAVHVQGTFIGFGERCGNANLSSIIPNLQLKSDFLCVPEDRMHFLTDTAREIAEISNVILASSSPFVGSSAFAHKGGMHIDGVTKVSRSFEHVDPETVGNERRFLMSEVSGRSTIITRIQKVDPTLTKDSPETREIMAKLKELEHEGYQFEGAEASFELLIRKLLGRYKPFFALDEYKIICEQPFSSEGFSSSAMIQIKVSGEKEITASQGDGPVNAIDRALRKALMVFYPRLGEVRLTDYKVRVLEPQAATAAKVRVLIETTDGDDIWTTVGVSTDIIDASWIALVDSIEYKFTKDFESEKRNKV